MIAKNRRLPALLAVAVLAWAGCSGHHHPLAKVSGTVTRGGKPVPDAIVTFVPLNGRPSSGDTDPAGHFTLTYDEKHAGAEKGRHKVIVVPVQKARPGEEQKRAGLSKEQRELLEKYGSEVTTPLEVDVNQDPQVIDLKLD